LVRINKNPVAANSYTEKKFTCARDKLFVKSDNSQKKVCNLPPVTLLSNRKMKTKQTFIAILFCAALSMSAGEPFFLGENRTGKINTLPMFGKKITENRLKLVKSGSGKEWDMGEVTGGGLFINFGIFFPPANYLNPYYESGDVRYKMGFDFEFGNFFRFAKIDDGKLGIGMRANWLSFSYAKLTDDKDTYRSLQIRPIHIGPQMSYAIDEYMGVDAYYDFGWNLTEQFGSVYSPGNKKNIGASWTYSGFSQEIGANFHYKVFCLGFGYRFGRVTNVAFVYDGKAMDSALLDDKKSSVNNFRIAIGFRF
jgi:hypothetical protein